MHDQLSHGSEIFPNTTGLFAPVAEGTFDGLWFQVSYARAAKATASFAPEGIPNSSEERTLNPSSSTPDDNARINVGFLVPPPDVMSSEKLPFFTTYSRSASRMESAVNSVAVATTSFFSTGVSCSFPHMLHACRNSRANSR